MSLCKLCKLRVDRKDPKLCCTVCDHYFHLTCCNVTESELLFIAPLFKCAICLGERRKSVSQVTVNASNAMSDAVINDGDCVSPTVESKEQPVVAGSAPLNDASSQTDLCDEYVSRDLVLAELRELRQSHQNLIMVVNGLKDDNSKLLDIVVELKLSVDQLKKLSGVSAQATETSPKRKKKKNSSSISSNNSAALEPVLQPDNDNAVSNNVVKDKPSFASFLRTGNPTDVSNQSGWSIATNSKPKPLSKKPTLIGAGSNKDLCVIEQKKWLHLSSFANSVSPDNIMDFVHNKFGISKDNLNCFKLVKKDANISNYKFVNFKLGVPAGSVDKLFDASIWPANIRIREFDFLEKTVNLVNL